MKLIFEERKLKLTSFSIISRERIYVITLESVIAKVLNELLSTTFKSTNPLKQLN